MHQGLQQLHHFAVDIFNASGAATRRTRPPPSSADSWRESATQSGTNGSPCRVAAAVRRWSRLVVVVVAWSLNASVPGCPRDPALCRPAGPSRRVLCQLPRRCIARARNLCTNWLHQLQLRPLQENCNCCTGATVASSVRGPRSASAIRQSGQSDACSVAAASQQQAQQPRRTTYRAKCP